MRLLITLITLFAVACASSSYSEGSDLDELRVLRNMDATHTFSVRDTADSDIGGYIVEFFDAPDGSTDERQWPAGTVLVQDIDLKTIGFVSRGGRAYRFLESNKSELLNARGRHAQIAELLEMNTPIEVRSALHGVAVPNGN